MQSRDNPEVVTLASDRSIQETPVNAFPAENLHEYRISPETAQLFGLHARRMQEELERSDSVVRHSTNLIAPSLSQRRSSTDLRRKQVVK